MDYIRAFYSLDKTPIKYITHFMLPIVGGGVAVVLLLSFLIPQAFEGITSVLLYTIPVYIFIFTLIYPIFISERKKIDIEKNIHFFITHIGALATSDMPRKDLFKTISKKPEYGELAKECGKLYMMMDTWHMSLAEACRFLSKQTQSKIFSDFLERFAHAMESGQKMEDFLGSEQDVVMVNYEVMYHGALYDLDMMKEILESIVITLIFIISFAVIMPFLTGQDIVQLLSISLFIFTTAEIMIAYFMKSKVPHDNIWHSLNMKTDVEKKFKLFLIISVVGCIIIFILVLSVGKTLPLPLKAALSFTPLIIAGFFVRKEEVLIKCRDEDYAEFIRSLGSSADTRGGIIEKALMYITLHDFGTLSKNIRNLYKRLRTRIDKLASWQHFEAECGSNLIQRFSEMFVESLNVGGKPLPISKIISKNFGKIQALRKQRYQNTSSFIGIMYGLQAGIAFSVYISFGVVKMMNNLFISIDVPEEITSSLLYTFEPSEINIIPFMLLAVLIAHALISAVLIRIADGGRMLNTLIHFVGIVWVGALTAIVVEKMLASLLPG
ncbi:MAG: Type II secretion system (T2SS), protein F [Candidatus Argoarchaeum ethanivorans]|uniref:Type II secretion system (T2SS), protein F n=1 Tax=Candidatus Argoarchaeum ethanivorans TaxID=2608793 RepID=A0A811TBX1_9EURY|nr:MAG: Type II secretion system (T2SS), protein F [Candidatus Argoarchaeum ethanivorans]